MSRHALLAVALSSVAVAATGGEGRRESPGAATAPVPLHEVSGVTMAGQGFLAWVDPPRCGEGGEVFFLLVPSFEPGKRPARRVAPSDVLGISADGKTATHFSPAGLPALADAGEVTTGAVALDAGGQVYLLVFAANREGNGAQYIVSFDREGGHRSTVEVPREIAVGSFDVFGSGAFLLRGRVAEPDGARRVAVMPAGGGRLRYVVRLPADTEDPFDLPRLQGFTVRAGDGRVLMTLPDATWIEAVDDDGDAEPVLRLGRVPRAWNPRGLMAAGSRVAVVYDDAKPAPPGQAQTGQFWIDVYDTVVAERVARYGPVSAPPLCYANRGSQDEFTVLGDGPRLVRMAP